ERWGRRWRREAWGRVTRVTIRLPVARDVSQRECFVEIVFDERGGDVGARFFEVTLQAVEVAVINRCGLVAVGCQRTTVCGHPRNAVAGQVVLIQVRVTQRDAGGRAEAENNGRRNAPAFVVNLIATSNVRLVPHAVQANG